MTPPKHYSHRTPKPKSVTITENFSDIIRSHQIFKTNHHNLYEQLLRPEKDEKLSVELMQNAWKPTIKNEYIRTLDVKLHAASTSMVAFIDLSREKLKQYKGETFFSTYERSNNQIRTNPDYFFLRQFRNYLTHFGVAPLRLTSPMTVDSTRILLTPEDLMAYQGWGIVLKKGKLVKSLEDENAVKEYLRQHPEGVYLAPIIKSYMDDMNKMWSTTIVSIARLETGGS